MNLIISTYICVHGSLGHVTTNVYMRAWFSRACYHKRIYACVALEELKRNQNVHNG